ncbi:MAG: class F sortase [Motilibacteraceae bacterium]
MAATRFGGRRGALTAAAAGLATLGVGSIGWAATHQPAPPPVPAAVTVAGAPGVTPSQPVSSASPSALPSSDNASERVVPAPSPSGPVAAPALPASKPVRIVIPKMGLDKPLVGEGLEPSGELKAPDRPDQVGWYTGAPTPGAQGPAVIEGHVTWNGDPAAFYQLGKLVPGDKVEVTRADGKVAVYTVTGGKVYDKDQFPTADVYGNLDYPGLRLITCGGTYDKAHHRYLGNLVVFATMTSVKSA